LSGGDENGGGSGGGSGGGGGGAELGVPVAEALDHATSLCKVADLEQARARCRGALGGAEPWLPQLGCSGAAREAPRRVKRRALRALVGVGVTGRPAVPCGLGHGGPAAP